MRLSVVIRTFTEGRWDSFVAAITSVQEQRLAPEEIVVVVDHNPDLLAKVRRQFPDAVAVENSMARGSSGGWNTGIAVARHDVIAFLDDDAVAAPDWLQWLQSGYQSDAVAGVGGAIEPAWGGGRPPWFPAGFEWVQGCTYEGLPEQRAPVRNLIGCNMSFRRQVLVDLGGFGEGMGRVGDDDQVMAGFWQSGGKRGYFHGCDETLLCIRLRQRFPEALLLYEPRARVYHSIPANRKTWSYFRSRCYLEGCSKALVAQLVGAQDGLSAERAHLLRALPRVFSRGLADTAIRHDLTGLARAGAVAAGVAITASGYLSGLAFLRVTEGWGAGLRSNPGFLSQGEKIRDDAG